MCISILQPKPCFGVKFYYLHYYIYLTKHDLGTPQTNAWFLNQAHDKINKIIIEDKKKNHNE